MKLYFSVLLILINNCLNCLSFDVLTNIFYTNSLNYENVLKITTSWNSLDCARHCDVQEKCDGVAVKDDKCFLLQKVDQLQAGDTVDEYQLIKFELRYQCTLKGTKQYCNYSNCFLSDSNRNMVPCQQVLHPITDCAFFYHEGYRKSGIFRVSPDGKDPFDVNCIMSSSNVGVDILRRKSPTNFNRNWSEYVNGFDGGREWLGLEKIYRLSSSKALALYIILYPYVGDAEGSKWTTFSLGDMSTNYKLSISGYSGKIGDSLSNHNGKPFSTPDADHDDNPNVNCAEKYKSGWWFHDCMDCNLNGVYRSGYHPDPLHGINWVLHKGEYYSYKAVAVKLVYTIAK